MLGRLTVIKSLVLSKSKHLFLALPNPPRDLIKRLERIFYKFLWNSGPDRIKRSVIIKKLNAGGLRMIHIQYFLKALKVSWFRRVIKNSKNSLWYSLSNIQLETLFNMGSGYSIQVNKKKIASPFWKEILWHWNEFCDMVTGWSGGAKVSCILCHRGVQLILAYSWARPAILVAGKGREVMFLFLLFLHFHSCSSFFPVPLFHLFCYLFCLFSPFLWETTQNDPQGLTCR